MESLLKSSRQSRPDTNGDAHRLSDLESDVTMDELRGHMMRMHVNVESMAKDVKSLMREHRRAKATQTTGVVGVVGIVGERIMESAMQQNHPESLAALVAVLIAMLFMQRRGTKSKEAE